MPDVSNKGSHKFWREYPDPVVYQVISLMESVENWTHDGNLEVEKIIAEFGIILDDIGNVDLREEEKLIQFLSCAISNNKCN